MNKLHPRRAPLQGMHKDEEVVYTFDFSNFPEVLAGQSISNPVITLSGSPGNLTITTAAQVQNPKVLIELSAASAVNGVTYVVTCKVDTSLGQKRVIEGPIKVG